MSSPSLTGWARTRAEWQAVRVASRPLAPAAHPRSAAEVRARTTALVGRLLAALFVVTWAVSMSVGFQSTLLFLNLVGFAAAFAGLKHPGIGLLGLGTLCTLEPITGPLLATGGLWRWNNLNYWLLFVSVVFLPAVIRIGDLHTRLFQVLTVVIIAGLAVSPNVFSGVQSVFTMVTALGLLVYFIRASQDREAWFWLGIVTGALAALGSPVYYLQIDNLPELHRNVWCLFPVTAIVAICLAFAVEARPGRQMVLGGLAIVNFTWVFLSASRGGLVTAVICVLYLLFQVRGMSRKLMLSGIGFLLATVILSQFAGFQEFAMGRINELLDPSKSTAERTSNRSELALAGWHLFLNNPMGVGTGGFGQAQSELALFTWSRSKNFAAHSGWVRVLAENGIFGILALTAYVGSFAFVGWQRRHRGMLHVGLLTTLVFAIGLTSFEFEHKGVWLLAAGATILLHPPAILGQKNAGATRPLLSHVPQGA